MTAIPTLANPKQFSRIEQSQLTSIVVEGEIGSGKSTTLNFLCSRYAIMNNLDYKDSMFRYGRQTERVTTKVDSKKIGGLVLIDTPGTNDIKTELSDYDIQKMKHEAISDRMNDPNQGISAILQCIMVDGGGRIKNTAIESMCKTFHSLSYTNPNFNLQGGGPRLCVIFTNLSKYQTEEDDIGPLGAESETRYDSPPIFENLVVQFRTQVFNQLYKDLDGKISKGDLECRVAAILGEKNFYAFKAYSQSSPNYAAKMQQEQAELDNCLLEASAWGAWAFA